MRKLIVCIAIVLLTASAVVFALDNPSGDASKTNSYTISLANGTQISFSETHELEKATLWWLGYEIILQGKTPGGIYVYDEYNKNFRGYSTPATPEGFYNKPSVQNASVMLLVPANILSLLFRSLNDTSTVAYLADYDDEPMLCAVIYKLPANYVFEDSVHFFVGKALDNTIVSYGYDPQVFYSKSTEMGMGDREQLIERGIKGESISAMLNEIRTQLWRANERNIEHTFVTRRNMLIGLGSMALLCIILLGFLSFYAKKDTQKKNRENKD